MYRSASRLVRGPSAIGRYRRLGLFPPRYRPKLIGNGRFRLSSPATGWSNAVSPTVAMETATALQHHFISMVFAEYYIFKWYLISSYSWLTNQYSMLELDLNLSMLTPRFSIPICTARYGRYIPVRQVTGTWTAHSRAVPPKSTVGSRLREKSTVGG
ncbi:hypothetical protein BHM03_00037814 [Ensete ventricosum]|nr:hypothetical protein BHM03_00037814 [Ensete ventricosum]